MTKHECRMTTTGCGRASNCALRKAAIKGVHRRNETRHSVVAGRESVAKRSVLQWLSNHAPGDSASKNRDGATHRSRAGWGLFHWAALLQTRLQVLGLHSASGSTMEHSGDGNVK